MGTSRAAREARETSVRDALAAFTSQDSLRATAATVLGRDEDRRSHPRESPVIAIIVLVIVAFGLVLAAEKGAASCRPLTYGFLGMPPETARDEFRRATAEIRLRTGIHLEEATSHPAELLVAWLPGGVTGDLPPESGFDVESEAPIGFASALWAESSGVRRLESARIVVDGSRDWERGLGSQDLLGAVFIHELAHVIGLDHSPDPASYMHPRMGASPQWTPEDLAELARRGELSGCGPPLTTP